MCVWNVTSGLCIEKTKLPYRHTAIYVSIETSHEISPFITGGVFPLLILFVFLMQF